MVAEVLANPAARPSVPELGVEAGAGAVLAAQRSLPGYAPTPLRTCPALARRLGVGTVVVKDEASRLGLPSFKILGASYASLQAVRRAWAPDAGCDVGELAGRLAAEGRPRGLAAATDGNHGRGVARMAALLGLRCRILVPAGTAAARIDAIASEGAEVEVVDGTYDDAIRRSAALASEDVLVVSDTSWPGYERTPREVIAGYETLFAEIDEQLDAAGWPAPDAVALQAGVGAFAAAGVRHHRQPGGRRPVTIVVEPGTANCLMASARAGTPMEVPGPHRSVMAGLNCGLPSLIAWPIVAAGTDLFVAIDDAAAEEAMRWLAEEGIVAGESGAAGLAGAAAILAPDHPGGWRGHLGLDSHACLLVVNTEGATDPEHYRAVVGRHPAGVAAPAGAATEPATGGAR